MKIVYASRTGNIQSIMDQLTIDHPIQLINGDEICDEPFILFTYTDGWGDIPYEVDQFLLNHADKIKGVIVSGDKSYEDTYCKAGQLIATNYFVPCLYQVENQGEPSDIEAIEKIIKEFI